MISSLDALIMDLEAYLKGPRADETDRFLLRALCELTRVRDHINHHDTRDHQFIWNAIHKIADAAGVTL